MYTGNAILVYFSDGSYFCISSASDDQLSVHNLVLCLHVHLSKSVKYNYSSSSSSSLSYPDSAKSSREVWEATGYEKLLYSIYISEVTLHSLGMRQDPSLICTHINKML